MPGQGPPAEPEGRGRRPAGGARGRSMGQPVRPDAAGEHDPDVAYRQGMDIAMRALSARELTRAEILQRLSRKGITEPAADAVVQRLTELALIDDVRFAAAWIDSRQRTRKLAGRALGVELNRRGVPAEVATRALAKIDHQTEARAAFELARQRVARSPGVGPDVLTRRVAAALARRGYPPDLCFRAVRAALADTGPVDDRAEGVLP